MKNKIIVQCGIKTEDEYWFVAGNTNGLFKKSLSTGQIDFVGFFPEEGKLAFRLYSDMTIVDDKIIFAPCHTKTFATYRLKEKTFSGIPIENEGEDYYNQYLRLVTYQDSVYYIPFWASSFVKYSVRDESAEVLDEWNKICNKYADPEIKNFIIDTICINHNCIYMFTSRNNRAVVLDMETDRFWIKELNISAEEYITSAYLHDQTIWIVTDTNKIYRWNIVSDEQDFILDLDQSSETPGFYTHHFYVTDQYLYRINVFDKNIRMFDLLNNEALILDMNEYIRDKEDDCISLYYYFDVHCVDNKLYMYSFYDGKYILVDGDEVTDMDILGSFYIPEEYWGDFYNEIVSKSCLMNLGMSFVEWLGHTLVSDKAILEKNSNKNYVGKLIYDTVIKDVT